MEGKIKLELTRDEIENIIQWGNLVESEYHLTEKELDLINKLEESLT